MEPNALEALLTTLSKAEIPSNITEAKPSKLDVSNGTAIVPIKGYLMESVPEYYKLLGIEATSYKDIRSQVAEALSDKDVESILLDVDSPGGITDGVYETGSQIREARSQKPVNARITGLGASAAYWLASQANSIGASPTAQVGSIGVYMSLVDYSKHAESLGARVILVSSGKHKGTGLPGTKISDEQVKPYQKIVDQLSALFVDEVAVGRQESKLKVKGWADGRVWLAQEAKSKGLIDSVTFGSSTHKEENVKEELVALLSAILGCANTEDAVKETLQKQGKDNPEIAGKVAELIASNQALESENAGLKETIASIEKKAKEEKLQGILAKVNEATGKPLDDSLKAIITGLIENGQGEQADTIVEKLCATSPKSQPSGTTAIPAVKSEDMMSKEDFGNTQKVIAEQLQAIGVPAKINEATGTVARTDGRAPIGKF